MDMMLTMRTVDTVPTRIVPGSVIRKCSRCQLDVFISPTSIDLAKTTPIVCLHCITPAEQEQFELHLIPGQMA